MQKAKANKKERRHPSPQGKKDDGKRGPKVEEKILGKVESHATKRKRRRLVETKIPKNETLKHPVVRMSQKIMLNRIPMTKSKKYSLSKTPKAPKAPSSNKKSGKRGPKPPPTKSSQNGTNEAKTPKERYGREVSKKRCLKIWKKRRSKTK